MVGLAAFGMGRCSLQLGQPGQAQRFFEKAIELLPELQPEIERMLARQT